MKKLNKVLLVDDDYISNFLNKLLIRDMNLADKTYFATNGEEALEFIKENCTTGNGEEITSDCLDLILLDINMPVMNGFEFLEEFYKIENRNSNIYIIMLTSSSDFKDMQKAKNYNVAGFINKPLTEEKINNIVSMLSES
jgi:CheY-like chemotaxis protein